MAARIGVVAIRDVTVGELLDHFPRLEGAHSTSANGWTWSSFNLFGGAGIVGPRADRILRDVDRTALQAWTEDGALWYLSIYRAGAEPFRHVHWFVFNDVAAGDVKKAKRRSLRALLDYYEDGLPEDYKYTGSLPRGSLATAMREHLASRAQALSDYLRAGDVHHDRGAVIRALTGESVTDEEWNWDVGNLPRLLDAIGVDDVPPGWKLDLEEDRADAARMLAEASQAAEAPAPNPVEPILRALEDGPPTPLAGGAVVTRPSILWLLPWSCDSDVLVGLRVKDVPSGFRWPTLEGVSVVEADGESHLGMPWQNVSARSRLLARLETSLLELPAGTEIELVSAGVAEPDDDEPPARAGNMRFAGRIEDGGWLVTHTYPATSKQKLQAALEILQWSAGKEPFTAHDAAEAERVVAELEKAVSMNEKDRPRIRGARVTIGAFYRAYLAAAFLRHRLADGPWDVASGQAADEELRTIMDDSIEKLAAVFGRAFAAPRANDVVLNGERSTFRKADMLQLKSAPSLTELFRTLYPARDFGERLELADAVRSVDDAMTTAGLTPLGDMVCEAFGDLVLRGYGRDGGAFYGVLIAGTLGQFVYEFYTEFTNGSSVTTSIQHGKNRPQAKSFHRHFPDTSVERLLEEHTTEVARRTTKKIRPAPHPPELAELAKRIDRFLVRAGL